MRRAPLAVDRLIERISANIRGYRYDSSEAEGDAASDDDDDEVAAKPGMSLPPLRPSFSLSTLSGTF